MSRGMSENCNLIGLPKSKTADSAQPRYRSIVTIPFSLLVRAGSGHETSYRDASPLFVRRPLPTLIMRVRKGQHQRMSESHLVLLCYHFRRDAAVFVPDRSVP